MGLLVMLLNIVSSPESWEICGAGRPQPPPEVPLSAPAYNLHLSSCARQGAHIPAHRQSLGFRLMSCHYNFEKSQTLENNKTVCRAAI